MSTTAIFDVWRFVRFCARPTSYYCVCNSSQLNNNSFWSETSPFMLMTHKSTHISLRKYSKKVSHIFPVKPKYAPCDPILIKFDPSPFV